MEWAGLGVVTLALAAAAAWRWQERQPVPRRRVGLCWIVGYWRTAAARPTAWRSVWSAAPSASPHRAANQGPTTSRFLSQRIETFWIQNT